MVLANVPLFRFSFLGNIRRNHPFGNHPFGNHQKGSLGDKRAVSKRVVLANVPSFRFSFRGKKPTFWKPPFCEPPKKEKAPNSGKEKAHKHKQFGPDFPRTFLNLAPGCPGVKKFLPTTGAAGKRTFLCGRPRFFGADVHDPKGCRKTLYKKVCVDFWGPTNPQNLVNLLLLCGKHSPFAITYLPKLHFQK